MRHGACGRSSQPRLWHFFIALLQGHTSEPPAPPIAPYDYARHSDCRFAPNPRFALPVCPHRSCTSVFLYAGPSQTTL
eukprot:scaffold1886_cov97-Cylindrotheca_fusiformis.AAC.4